MPNTQYEQEMQKLYNELMKNKGEGGETNPPIVCPSTFDKPCRLCDLAKTILFKKDNEGTPIRQKASELNRKQSYYSNVLFPTNPSEIVVFQYGHSIWKELMLFQMGPGSEVADWLHPQTGRNVIITKTVAGGNKRRTQYSTKARITASPLLDMSVLRQLSLPQYQLSNVLDLIKSGTIKPFYQSQLQEGPNELRFLPSWLGPGITKFFQLVLYHYGFSEEEFNMIQRGDLNPFAGMDYSVEPEKPKVSIVPGPSSTNSISSKDLWSEFPIEEAPKVTTAPAIVAPSATQEANPSPPCFGKQFDPNDEECIVECAADGWAEPCKIAFEALQRSTFEKRKVAKRLIK